MQQEMDMTDNTKLSSQFSIRFDPFFSLHLSQQNNTQNHGTTVWDSAKLLAFYLFDVFKQPTFIKENNMIYPKHYKKMCLELGSGCGLVGLLMASLGFHTVLTDLPQVVDHLKSNCCQRVMDDILTWWYHLHHTCSDIIIKPNIQVTSLDWIKVKELPLIKYDYILASDCIYEIELVMPLLNCIKHYSTTNTIIYIAMERRDDKVIDGFIDKAKQNGFNAKMILKKLIQNHQNLVCNQDVEIWKLKLKKSQQNK